MKHYRNQPQATSHVYRSVLLAGKAAATSPQVGSIFTKYIDSPSTALNHRRQYHNPTPLQPPEDAPPALLWVRMGKNVEISSSSTMPSSFPLYRSMSDSNLQIVTWLIIMRSWYSNWGNFQIDQDYALRFKKSSGSNQPGANMPPLSPLPQLRANPSSPRRKVLHQLIKKLAAIDIL